MTTLRAATAADAAALAALAEQTFRDTFAAANTAEDMALHCRSSYSPDIQAKEIAHPETVTWVCLHEGALIGYAQLRWSEAPSCVAGQAPGEIQRLYVARAWHGRGIAQTLMEACLSELARRGSHVAWLGVWEKNPRAIAFYTKFGFTAVGDHVFPVGTDPQRDIIMVKALAPA